ncbi:AF4/FMR2 family member 1 isoform X2 [Pieris rapae]|uniref:AF4/FMR2 family member 1 isoform X2 n=1 Tax=Pieris rapae TaxID=64459 RepID=UPI001E27F464|nr:AF4/FMR2 family member 1 isoform X2 [Pieris rapae]
MHMCYERPGLVNALNAPNVGYDKWDRGGASGGAGGAGGATWSGRERDARDARESRDARDTRDRERDRERERQARAHQMSHAHTSEPPDNSSLFPAPFRVTGNRDRVSQQVQIKLGDYHLAQTLLDDPSKSIGICAEPASPAPCHPSRRESEFKKPAHAPQNGRIHHRPYPYNKSEGLSSTGSTGHRPPPLRIPNGFTAQNAIDSSSQPPIESILKEMKSLPTPLSVIAATPRKEAENKFIFNPYTNKVQENPQLANNDLKTPVTKSGLDSRISNSRNSISPDVVNKDLGLSESDDEVAATTTRLEPILSPIRSGGSPSSGSESSPSDSESESSSAESTAPVPAPAPAPPPAQRPSWGLSNFAPPPPEPPDHPDLTNVLADAKGKPSPISDLTDSEASSPSPGVRRRRSLANNRISTASSDEETPRAVPVRPQASPSVPQPIPGGSQSTGVKRGRPPKVRTSEERPPKKKRGRPKKTRPQSPAPPDSEPEPDPPVHHALQDTKTHIFRKVFTPKKGDECGGKGGKGGKGKGGKGKGQVTIIEVTAPESGADDDDRHRDRSTERRTEEAIARVSPPQESETYGRRRDAERNANDRIQGTPIERPDYRRTEDRPTIERTSVDRLPDRITNDRLVPERIPSDRRSTDRLPPDRPDRNDRAQDRLSNDRFQDRISTDRLQDRISTDRLQDRISTDRFQEKLSSDRLQERLSNDRLSNDLISPDRISDRSSDRLSTSDRMDRKSGDKMSIDRSSDKLDRLSSDKKISVDRVERITPERAEADVGFVQCPVPIVSERRSRSRVLVSIPLGRLRAELVRALRTPRRPGPPPAQVNTPLQSEVAATNHERPPPCLGQTPIYYSYFEQLPADALSDEERDHKYYLAEAKRLRSAAESEQHALPRVMLYLESVLCFVLTGRVLELELDTKRAFTIYRETIEYIKSIHSMPQRIRAEARKKGGEPHSTFSKLDILSLRVQALLYLRMFKMYNREVKEYYKIVQEYQQKVGNPACAESVSPLSPTPSPAGSVGSGGSASSGYCSLAHAVPAHAHNALLQLTKYYTFLYVAHDLWEQADCLCRLRPNQDLFIAVDRKCGPLTLFSTFRHLVQYVRYAISLLKSAPQ